jgi:hypothetical protein
MRRLLPLALFLAGCDVLFPEFSHPPPATDAGAGDAGGAPHISGRVCALADLRDFRTCASGPGASFRVADEETRESAQADASGAYDLVTSTALATATLAALDGASQYTPTITVVHPTAGVLEQLALPVVLQSTLARLALDNGFTVDPTRGALFTWTIDATGAPIAGVRAGAIAGGIGPLYDGAAPDELAVAQATGARGLVAQFNLTPGTATLDLAVGGAQPVPYALPIRAGAITMMALPLSH